MTPRRVRGFVETEVEAVNRELPKSERIKQFRLVPTEWTPDNGLLTPSMKVKRRAVADRFETELRDIYGDDSVA